jgi:hypothetical protein
LSRWPRRSELRLLVADRHTEKYEPGGHSLASPLRESLAVLALLAVIPVNRLAAAALAELLSRRRSCERIAEALVRWSRG